MSKPAVQPSRRLASWGFSAHISSRLDVKQNTPLYLVTTIRIHGAMPPLNHTLSLRNALLSMEPTVPYSLSCRQIVHL